MRNYNRVDIEAYVSACTTVVGYSEVLLEPHLLRVLVDTIEQASPMYQTLLLEQPHPIILGSKEEITKLYPKEGSIGGFYQLDSRAVHVVTDVLTASWQQTFWHEEGHRIDHQLSSVDGAFYSDLRPIWGRAVAQSVKEGRYFAILTSPLYKDADYPRESMAEMIKHHVLSGYPHEGKPRIVPACASLWPVFEEGLLYRMQRFASSLAEKRAKAVERFLAQSKFIADRNGLVFDAEAVREYIFSLEMSGQFRAELSALNAYIDGKSSLPNVFYYMFNSQGAHQPGAPTIF